MSERLPHLLIEDIIESCNKIREYTTGLTFEQFADDEKTIDAVVRNFEIIGEACNRLSDEYKDEHQDIDWYKIRGLRNRIVHHYFGIDYSIIWNIIEEYLPKMLEEIKNINNE